MKISDTTLVAGLALACAMIAAPAFAEIRVYKAALSGAEEVPPTITKGVGTVEITYDTATKKLGWKGTYSDLSGVATAAHFHGPAGIGKNGPVEVPVIAMSSPFEGSAVLNDVQASDLTAGKLYLNIHTVANPAGEIRGQVTRVK